MEQHGSFCQGAGRLTVCCRGVARCWASPAEVRHITARLCPVKRKRVFRAVALGVGAHHVACLEGDDEVCWCVALQWWWA